MKFVKPPICDFEYTCDMCGELSVNGTIENHEQIDFQGWEVVFHNISGVEHTVQMMKAIDGVNHYKTHYFRLDDCYEADACPLFCETDSGCPLDYECQPGACGSSFDDSESCCVQSDLRNVVTFDLFLNESGSPMNVSRFNDYNYDLINHLKQLLTVDELYTAIDSFPKTYGDLTTYIYDVSQLSVNRTKYGLPIRVALKTSNPARVIQRIFQDDFETEVALRFRKNNPALQKIHVKSTNATSNVN